MTTAADQPIGAGNNRDPHQVERGDRVTREGETLLRVTASTWCVLFRRRVWNPQGELVARLPLFALCTAPAGACHWLLVACACASASRRPGGTLVGVTESQKRWARRDAGLASGTLDADVNHWASGRRHSAGCISTTAG